MTLNILEMLRIGEACGLDTVEEAFSDYMNHYDLFFLMENYHKQYNELIDELVRSKIVTEVEKGKYTFINISIKDALILLGEPA